MLSHTLLPTYSLISGDAISIIGIEDSVLQRMVAKGNAPASFRTAKLDRFRELLSLKGIQALEYGATASQDLPGSEEAAAVSSNVVDQFGLVVDPLHANAVGTSTSHANMETTTGFLSPGGTGGLGAESVVQLAQHHPRAIYFSGRNSKRAEEVIQKVQANTSDAPALHFVECNLASLQSVAAAAQHFLDQSDRLDVLMCNAGIMAVPPGLTTDGYEVQFGTNHVGHALLIKKLLPLLAATGHDPDADVRIVLLTSLGFLMHPSGGIVFEDVKTVQDFKVFGPFLRYGQSKLANILYARELARRYPQITTVSIHPGVASTGIIGETSCVNKAIIYATAWWQMVPAEQGAYNQLWAACGEVPKESNGQMYEPVGVLSTKLDKTTKDDKLAEQLWEWTEGELSKY